MTTNPHPLNGVADHVTDRAMIRSYSDNETIPLAPLRFLKSSDGDTDSHATIRKLWRQPSMRAQVAGRAIAKNGACTSISLLGWPIAQFTGFAFALSFFEQEVEFTGCKVFIHLLIPGNLSESTPRIRMAR